jgi:hypothetical protein
MNFRRQKGGVKLLGMGRYIEHGRNEEVKQKEARGGM